MRPVSQLGPLFGGSLLSLWSDAAIIPVFPSLNVLPENHSMFPSQTPKDSEEEKQSQIHDEHQ